MYKKLLILGAAISTCACSGNPVTSNPATSSTVNSLSSAAIASSVSSAIASSSSAPSSSSITPSSSSAAASSLSPENCTGSPTNAGPSTTPIRINQLGFLPASKKVAVIEKPSNTQFYIARASDNTKVFCGTYSAEATWSASGETVRKADFSSVTTPGTYYLADVGGRKSYTFEIGNSVFKDVTEAAVKAYYFNRASTALPAQYAGIWQRAAGHPDTNVIVHESAKSATRPTGTVISAPKGWYDAGDYNKYIVNAGISMYTLFAAYEQYSDYFKALKTNIPESNDNVPDILNEAMWNLEWMEKMQDPDGGVYHKLTTKNFSGEQMPNQATAQRYVVQRTTAATLDFAAVMAVASRIYANFEQAYPGKSALYRNAAIAAWNWADANPSVYYVQPSDIFTGEYGDKDVTDEFAWAAAELYLLTGQSSYLDRFKSIDADVGAPWWGGVATLGYISLAEHGKTTMPANDYQSVVNKLIAAASGTVSKYKASAYGVPMAHTSDKDTDFTWGSNSGAANQALVALYANRLQANKDFVDAATAAADYIFGRNATGYSFVTGTGAKSPMNIHHRPSVADGIADPVPGFLVGGPHAMQPETPKCNYPSSLPAKSFSDTWCSYSTNEITINWNAPLIYILAALQNLK
ncbi:MAG: glycoside hydrolase family 9 protein [Marinagarivorans sp.]|nr:glycoside hydrolase family 9 protein [Marinagarivorans sp.]